MIREYSLKIKSYGSLISDDRYASLWDACLEIAKKLKNMNILDIIDKGSFEETVMSDSSYNKKYVINYSELNLQITLKKLSTGNINIELVKEYLKEIKILYERISN